MAKPELDSIFDIEPDEVAAAAADEAARTQIAAGNWIPHSEMMAWFQTWGKPNRPPRPRSKAE